MKNKKLSKRTATLSIQFYRKLGEDCLQMLITHNEKSKKNWSNWENSDSYYFGMCMAKMCKKEIKQFSNFLEGFSLNFLKERGFNVDGKVK